MNGISKEFPTGFPTSGWISRKAPSASFIRQRILNPPLYYLVHNTIFLNLRIKITYIRISSKILKTIFYIYIYIFISYIYIYIYIYIFIYNNYLSQKSRFLPKLICDSRNSFQWLTKLIESSFICCSKEKKSKLGCRRRQLCEIQTVKRVWKSNFNGSAALVWKRRAKTETERKRKEKWHRFQGEGSVS